MFSLENAVSIWRSRLRRSNRMAEADIAELESHLRDSIDELSLLPLSIEEAFVLASYRLGDAGSLTVEFSKNQHRHAEFLPLTHVDHNGCVDEQVYAGFSRRLMASLFDMSVFMLVSLFMLCSVMWLSLSWGVFALLILQVSFSAYLISMTYCYGGTLGKILAGIKIARRDGSALSLGQTFRRNAPYLLFSLLELILYFQVVNEVLVPGASIVYLWVWRSVVIAGACWLLASIVLLVRNKHSRTLHDYFANTIVVDEKYARINAAGKISDPSAGSVLA